MIKCILCVGAPASGKSFWAKSEVTKDPTNWVRINNDDIRAMTNGSVYSSDYEKLITYWTLPLEIRADQWAKKFVENNVELCEWFDRNIHELKNKLLKSLD